MNLKKLISNRKIYKWRCKIMPMLSGTHQCSKCGLKMYWEKHILFKCGYEYFTYTKGSYAVKLLNNKMSDILEFRIECDKCNQVDFFTYDTCSLHNKTR